MSWVTRNGAHQVNCTATPYHPILGLRGGIKGIWGTIWHHEFLKITPSYQGIGIFLGTFWACSSSIWEYSKNPRGTCSKSPSLNEGTGRSSHWQRQWFKTGPFNSFFKERLLLESNQQLYHWLSFVHGAQDSHTIVIPYQRLLLLKGYSIWFPSRRGL